MAEVQLPPGLRAPLFGLACAALITCSAWGIEAYRLTSALAVEAEYHARYEQSRLELSRVRVLYAHVERMAGMVRKVRDIQISGTRRAQEFADVGNRLSEHVWLTALSNDETGIAMTGKAADFSALGRAITSLAAARGKYAPVLIRASRDARAGRSEQLSYDLHLDGSR